MGLRLKERIAVLVGLAAVFVIVTLTLRVAELRPFSVLIVVLAAMTAAGTIYEKKTGYNLFYSTATAVFAPVATVEPPPTTSVPIQASRTPTDHGTDPPPAVADLAPCHGAAFAVVLSAIAPGLPRRLSGVSSPA